jgi:hypothetical protein
LFCRHRLTRAQNSRSTGLVALVFLLAIRLGPSSRGETLVSLLSEKGLDSDPK